MQHTYTPKTLASKARYLLAALSSAALVIIAACGGGGTTSDNGASSSSGTSNNGTPTSGLRALPQDFITRKAVAYSPYRTATTVDGRASEVITDAMVKQDLDLIVGSGIGLIRLFDSTEKVAARTLRVIKANNMNLKVMLGAYVNSYEYYSGASASTLADIQAANNEEIARTVALANAYPDIVLAVSVGNETQVDWSFVQISSKQLASYIKTVRDQITQPVTTDDNYAPFAGKQMHHAAANQITEVLAQVDFVSIHTYSIEDVLYSNFSDSDNWPDWDWQQKTVTDSSLRAAAMMDAAIAKTKKDYTLARTYMNSVGKSSLPIIIGETGWKAADPSGTGRYRFLANPANQKMYYDRLMTWAQTSRNADGPQNIIYFEAFDEPWKGSDDKWGLFNVNRQARYAVQAKNAASSTWVYEYKTGTTPYTDADAVSWSAPTLNTAIASSRYTIFADTVTAGETRASASTTDVRWDAFDGDSAAYPTISTDSAPTDASNSIQITPNPKSYGWGLLYHSSSDISSNLSGYSDTATLNFSIKTSYVGKIEIGISTDTEDRTAQEAYLQIASGSYGYKNDGTWTTVSIPLSAFKAANSKIDLKYVLSRFIIADRYSYTGNTLKTQTAKILIDNIYWSK